jgi:hypothetical protein
MAKYFTAPLGMLLSAHESTHGSIAMIHALREDQKEPIPYPVLPARDAYAHACQNPSYFHSLCNFMPPEFDQLYDDIQHLLPLSVLRHGVPSRTWVLAALNFLKTGCNLTDIVRLTGTNVSTVVRHLWPVLAALADGTAADISWPDVHERKELHGKMFDW